MHGAPNSLPPAPSHHLMEFATLIDFYDFERTDAEPHESAVSTSGIYRLEKGPSLKMGIYGRDDKSSLTCQRTPSATMAPYQGASRYLRCGVRLQEELGKLQAIGSKERPGSNSRAKIKLKNSTRLNQFPRKEHCKGLLQNHSSKFQRGAKQYAKYRPTCFWDHEC